MQQLKQGLAYFNVDSSTFPGGEIRGQINAAPQTTNDFAPPSNIYALTAGNWLLTFNSSQPNVMGNNVAITGLQAGEILRGIDIRPANSQLYGLGSTNRLYTINVQTGAATAIGAAPFTPGLNGSVSLLVTRTGDLSGTATVDYDSNAGSASERRDYTTAAGVLRFAPGEAAKTITVFITDDKYTEQDETFTVTLSNPVGAGFNAPTTITGTLVDNDTGPPTPNPLNDTPFFVRQHYIDFLNREPDSDGFNAFAALLNNCADRLNNPACDRVAVSSSFARSPEFRLKAEFAIRFYIATFNRLPTDREFIRDRSTLNGATAAEVMANLARFPVDFVEREEYRTIFDPLSNTAFVDRLIANAGVANAGRDQFITDLNAGVKTRAQVLREIVDNNVFAQAETNRAYILAQYFGYLRRDPDPAGFNNLLNFLNANPSNFREVTRSFVDSTEYRARFGTP